MSTRDESYLVGLIGHGITQSLTPPMHEAEAVHHGMQYLYRPVDLQAHEAPEMDLGTLLRAGVLLGFNAFNITHPFKQTVLEHLDLVAPRAQALGAVNTVLVRDGQLEGYNTDWSGFEMGMRSALPDVDLSRVVQFGSGGAGSAVAEALLALGVQRLDLIDLDVPRAAERVSVLASRYQGVQVNVAPPEAAAELVSQATGVVNATPMGMHHHPGAPFDLALLKPQHWVSDVVYLPLRTPLLEAAEELGCRVMDGGYMAVGQAVDAFRIITGQDPDADRMRADFLRRTGQRPPETVAAAPMPVAPVEDVR